MLFLVIIIHIFLSEVEVLMWDNFLKDVSLSCVSYKTVDNSPELDPPEQPMCWTALSVTANSCN